MIDILLLIFNFIPNIVIHVILGIGLFGSIIFNFFPSILGEIFSPYKYLKYIFIVIFILGVYLEGGLAVTNEYILKEKEWNSKIEIAELKADSINKELDYYKNLKLEQQKEVKILIKSNIKKVAQKIDSKCELTEETIYNHNLAARGKHD